MKQPINIFKNSGIRDLASQQRTFWLWLKELCTKNTSFITGKNISYLALAISLYFHKKYNHPCNILIGTDTRISKSWIKKRMISGFLELGNHVFDTDIVPTPCIAQTLKHYHNQSTNTPFFHLGIMITASHNPAHYNGIKIMTPAGYLTLDDELHISQIFHSLLKNPQNIFQYERLKKQGTLTTFNGSDFYTSEILKKIKSFQTSDTIVLDCAHGATYDIAPKIFKSYFKHVIEINNSSNGAFINANSGCTNPQLLVQAVQQHNADWGCAFDGDGDRLIIANKQGTVFDGDDILYILSLHEKFKNEKIFVGTIMNNLATEHYFTSHNQTLIRTDVGERNLIEALEHYNAQIGSEPCGHITIMDHARCSDGIFAALMFFDTIYTKADILNHRYPKYQQLHTTIPLQNIVIDNQTIESVTTEYNQNLYPNGRVIIRKSNTEPILRITTEHINYDKAEQAMTNLKKQFQKTL